MRKKLQDLTIKDAFMFAAVMSDAEQCRHLLELVLEMKILEVNVVAEKTISYHPEYHGVRLDVMAEEAGTKRRFNVEMQVKTETALAKRSRYYHAQMDMDALLTGESYDRLPDTYGIYICDFDPFGDQLYRYTARNMIYETNKLLADGNHTIILSTKGKNFNDVPIQLVNFLEYVGQDTDNVKIDDAYLRLLQELVKSIKQDRDWEGRYMLLQEMMSEERMAGRKEGLEIGRQEGLEAGRRESLDNMNQLIILLSEQNRKDDILKAANYKIFQELNDIVIQKQLYLSSELSREDLAQIVHLNNARFARMIRECTGTNFKGYINELRINYAIELMKKHPNYTIRAIADEAGFNSTPILYNLFKKKTGMTPYEFKKAQDSLQN